MLDNQRKYELVIRPLGRSRADEYVHNQAVWVEGREGNSYTIDITNHTYARTLFIVSVDGLDVLEGKTAGLNSQGYVLNGRETISIPGWKLDNNQAAEFYFSGNKSSYVDSIGGDTSNTGVIGAMAFSEYVQPYYQYSNFTVGGTAGNPRDMFGTTSRGINSGGALHVNDIAVHYSGNSGIAQNASMGPTGMAGPKGVLGSAGAAGIYNVSAETTQDVGTGFGDATDWNTVTTSFRRANPNNPDAILAIYYNTAKNLERMGIQLRRKKSYTRSANPFPGYNNNGCPTPPGWKSK